MSDTNTPTNPNPVIIFLDAVGRTIIGQLVSEDETILKVKNPAILHVVATAPSQQNPQGGMQVQTIPVFFQEFAGDKTADVVLSYPKVNLVRTDVPVLDFRLEQQYRNIFNKDNIIVPPGTSNGIVAPGQTEKSNIIKLFGN